jgi:hypothetical protein
MMRHATRIIIERIRPMRGMLFALLLAVPLTGAQAGVGPFEANDIGGIIAWSPQAQREARYVAHDHCARYGKLARITSVNPRYGAYIAFACQFPRAYVVRHRSRTVLRVRY